MDLLCKHLDKESTISITSYVAALHPVWDSCGHNGLPLTPNSISIMGRAEKLKNISQNHPYLCLFLECLKAKHEKIILVSEHFSDCLKGRLSQFSDTLVDNFNEEFILNMGKEILIGLSFLHKQSIIHFTLEPSNICFNKENKVKLFNYGMGYMTDYGLHVSFPIFNPRYAAPEVIVSSYSSITQSSSNNFQQHSVKNDLKKDVLYSTFSEKCDVWSLGIILACCVLNISKPWLKLNSSQILRRVLSFSQIENGIFYTIAKDHNRIYKLNTISPKLRKLIDLCLQPNPSKRLTTNQILKIIFLYSCSSSGKVSAFPDLKLRSSNLILSYKFNLYEKPSDTLNISELYYLWKLAGGDIFFELKANGLVVSKSPIISIGKIVLIEGHTEGKIKDKSSLYNTIVIDLPLHKLQYCLKNTDLEFQHPLLFSCYNKETTDKTFQLPLIIKENDVKYQYKRILIFRKILQCYPFRLDLIWKEAKIDIVPLYRAWLWSILLGIDFKVMIQYESIDKETWTTTDRQIELDIPRCHQYNYLLSSPEGHMKLKRILKSWVIMNPQYVYWQGLDSLSAPFIYLNFNDESLAFACLSAFIDKFLYGMFRKENSLVIQEYLDKFNNLQAFVDAELYNHLKNIGFIPDLYAIPWILTMFAHVFPIQSIFHLWDRLLLCNSSFPLCIGLSIMIQLRERLLKSEFNDCILLFSDLPAINIEKSLRDSMKIFFTTPKSITWRKHGSNSFRKYNKIYSKTSHNCLNSKILTHKRGETIPSIEFEDVLEIIKSSRVYTSETNSSSYIQGKHIHKENILLIDIRNIEEFRKGSLQNSIHMPSLNVFDEVSKHLLPKFMKKFKKNNELICVVGSFKTNEITLEFGKRLISLNYNNVCVLKNGIESFKNYPELMCVPKI